MKVLHLSLADGGGGAHIAARRLHLALLAAGVESEMLVDSKSSDAPGINGINSEFMRGIASCRPSIDNMLTRIRCGGFKGGAFFSNLVPDFMMRRLKHRKFDIIHLHWVSGGFLRPATLPFLGVPVVWTMHDMWPFTGGCLYAGKCRKYESACGLCPFCNSNSARDISTVNQKDKRSSYRKARLHFVSPGKWLADCAKKSSVLRNSEISIISNCLDTEIFTPREKLLARSVFNLPVTERKILLFGAVGGLTDPRKGGDLLMASLEKLRGLYNSGETPLLLVFGGEKLGLRKSDNMDFFHVGKINDELTMSLLYSAADTFAAPSRADNLPNTVIEAMACGVSTVAFNIGGMPDILEGSGGILVEPFDTAAYAIALKEAMDFTPVKQKINRELALSKFSTAKVANVHIKLYSELLAGK